MNNSILQLSSSTPAIIDFIIKSLSSKSMFYCLSSRGNVKTIANTDTGRTIEYRFADDEPIWQLLREIHRLYPKFNLSYRYETIIVKKTKNSFFVKYRDEEKAKRVRSFDQALGYFDARTGSRLAA